MHYYSLDLQELRDEASNDEEWQPHKHGIEISTHAHDETRGGAEATDANADAKEGGPNHELGCNLLVGGQMIFFAIEGLGSDGEVPLEEGQASIGDELVGNEADGASGSKEEEEAGIVLLPGEDAEVEESQQLGWLRHATEGKAKGEDGCGKDGGEDLEVVGRHGRRVVAGLVFADVIVVVVKLSLDIGLVSIVVGRGVGSVDGRNLLPNLTIFAVDLADVDNVDDKGQTQKDREGNANSVRCRRKEGCCGIICQSSDIGPGTQKTGGEEAG